MGEDFADEVVVAVKEMVPDIFLEVHSHGGRQVVRFLTELLLAQGLQLCSWQELLGEVISDPITALAATELAQAATTRTAAILLDQHAGALGRAFDAVLAALDQADVSSACCHLDELLAQAPIGLHLTRPWRVVVAGAPNVGKSSLVNALAGYQRSIVSPVPGTTRDIVTLQLAIDGWPVEIADTAGMRFSESFLETEGVQRARSAVAAADLCFWVMDASAEPVCPGPEVRGTRLVVNKVDLPPTWDLTRAADAVHVSAATGAGLGDLCSFLGAHLVPQAPPPGAAVPFTASLVKAIMAARECAAAKDITAASSLLQVFRPCRRTP
jgi:tRNA modification GTPase